MFLTTLGFACGIIQLVAFSVIYMFMLGLFQWVRFCNRLIRVGCFPFFQRWSQGCAERNGWLMHSVKRYGVVDQELSGLTSSARW